MTQVLLPFRLFIQNRPWHLEINRWIYLCNNDYKIPILSSFQIMTDQTFCRRSCSQEDILFLFCFAAKKIHFLWKRKTRFCIPITMLSYWLNCVRGERKRRKSLLETHLHTAQTDFFSSISLFYTCCCCCCFSLVIDVVVVVFVVVLSVICNSIFKDT